MVSSDSLLQSHPRVAYRKVIEDRSVFMETLEDLLKAIGTKFRVPEIAGKPLDLHRLFVEVSLRGGIQKVIADGRWGEVTSLFTFPPTTPSAAFYIRSHYIVFLQTYEEFYLFRGKKPELPLNDVKIESASKASIPAVPNLQGAIVNSVFEGSIPPVPYLHSRAVSNNTSDVKIESVSEASIPAVLNLQGAKVNSVSKGSIPPVPYLHSRAVSNNTSGQHLLKVGDKVRGKMNGKFKHGYRITATIGSEVMHGVLYLVPMEQQAQPLNSHGNSQKRSRNDTSNSGLKSSDKGYHLFLHQLYPRIAPFYHEQEEITITHIKSLWNKLSEFEQKVYQDKATSK